MAMLVHLRRAPTHRYPGLTRGGFSRDVQCGRSNTQYWNVMAAPVSSNAPSLLLIEAGLTLITIGVAFCFPQLGSAFFSKVERLFAALARRRGLSVVVIGAGACFLRLLILPISPIPKPFIHD